MGTAHGAAVRRAPSSDWRGDHAGHIHLATAYRRQRGAGRPACTVRRRQRPDRRLRHRHGQRSAVRRQRPDLSRVGLARRRRPHDAPGPGPHGGAARGNAGRRAGGRFRRHRAAAVGRARRGDVQDHDRERAAQAYFDQGLRLAYAFNHDEAQRAFRKAQKLDPDCAMCFWGEALVLGPNINLPMQEDAVAPAFAAAEKARGARRQGEPARAGADRGGRGPLRQGSRRPTGRRSMRPMRRRWRRSRRSSPTTTRSRCSTPKR